ncbi:Gmad2 immunoglobulin-like domain-containing protein [Paenibacillus sp. strain BS8-2]
MSGEARVFEAVMNYTVEDGHNYLLEGHHMVAEGAPAWSPFAIDIEIPPAQQPVNGTLMLELFEYSAKDGSRVNVLSVPCRFL